MILGALFVYKKFITTAQEATLAKLKETARAKRATYRAAKAAYDTAKQIEREAAPILNNGSAITRPS